MTDSINEKDKVFVTGGRNKWGILQDIYANCADFKNKLYIINIDGKNGAYNREQFLTISDMNSALASVGVDIELVENL